MKIFIIFLFSFFVNSVYAPINSVVYAPPLDVKKDVNAKDKNGMTALHYATQKNDLKRVKELIRDGANVNAKRWGGMTPLYYAIGKRNILIIRELIKAGADVNAIGNGFTPLTYILSDSRKKSNLEVIVKALIKAGADVNAWGAGNSPLSIAVKRKKYAVAQLLREAGAKVYAEPFDVLLFRVIKNKL